MKQVFRKMQLCTLKYFAIIEVTVVTWMRSSFGDGGICPAGRVSDDCKPHSTLHDSQHHTTGKFDFMVGSKCSRQLLEEFGESGK